MATFNRVCCLLIPLISVAALVPVEGGAQAADVSPRRTFTVGHTIRRLNVPGMTRPIEIFSLAVFAAAVLLLASRAGQMCVVTWS